MTKPAAWMQACVIVLFLNTELLRLQQVFLQMSLTLNMFSTQEGHL